MLSIHWNIINANSFRHRLKNIPELKKEMIALPKQLSESHFYHIKTVLLSWRLPSLVVKESHAMPLSREFNHAAWKLNLSLLTLASFLKKLGEGHHKAQEEAEGFFYKIWSTSAGSDPLTNVEVQADLYQKLVDFDQNLRSLETAYLDNLKQVNSIFDPIATACSEET